MYETVLNDNLIDAVKTESTYLVRDLMQEDLVEMVLYGSCAGGDSHGIDNEAFCYCEFCLPAV